MTWTNANVRIPREVHDGRSHPGAPLEGKAPGHPQHARGEQRPPVPEGEVEDDERDERLRLLGEQPDELVGLQRREGAEHRRDPDDQHAGSRCVCWGMLSALSGVRRVRQQKTAPAPRPVTARAVMAAVRARPGSDRFRPCVSVAVRPRQQQGCASGHSGANTTAPSGGTVSGSDWSKPCARRHRVAAPQVANAAAAVRRASVFSSSR